MRTRVEGVKKAENFADIISGSSLSGFGRSAATCLTYVMFIISTSGQRRRGSGSVPLRDVLIILLISIGWIEEGRERETPFTCGQAVRSSRPLFVMIK